MNIRQSFLLLLVAAGVACNPLLSHAEDRIWTGAIDDQFLNAGNWEGGLPMVDDDLAIIDGGDNLPVIIPESAGEITIGGFQLGTSGDAGGHVIQNGGTVVVAPFSLENIPTDFEFKSHIGDKGTSNSSWIMNNDSVILYDSPLDGDGFGLNTDGENSFDLEIGAATGDAGVRKSCNTKVQIGSAQAQLLRTFCREKNVR